MNKKRIGFYVVPLLLAVILVACSGASNKESGKVSQNETGLVDVDSNQGNDEEQSTVEQPTEPETFSQPEIELIMVGDILLHDRLEEVAKQEDGSYNYEAIFEPMKEDIQSADLAIVNQEVLIGGEELGVSGYPCFNAPFTLGDALVDGGYCSRKAVRCYA